jgi:hypothetical protein
MILLARPSLAAYIAASALRMSSFGVWPSSGQLAMPMHAPISTLAPGTSMLSDSAARIWCATAMASSAEATSFPSKPKVPVSLPPQRGVIGRRRTICNGKIRQCVTCVTDVVKHTGRSEHLGLGTPQ